MSRPSEKTEAQLLKELAEIDNERQKIAEELNRKIVAGANKKAEAIEKAVEEFNNAAEKVNEKTPGTIELFKLLSMSEYNRLIDTPKTAKPKTEGKGGKRLRLSTEQIDALKNDILKIVKSYKADGVSTKTILETLAGPNYGRVDGKDYNDGFVRRYLADFKNEKKIKTEGNGPVNTKYIAL